MKKSVDWSEWILQKNNEAREEELRKSEFIEIDDLNKKVREPQISSPGWERAKYKPDAPHVEGAVKRKKYQGGDPRHEERMMQAGNFSHKTRSGQNREGGGQGEAFTSGVSTLRPKKHTDYEREEAEERVTGKKIKLNKSEDDLPDHSDWSEWTLQKNSEYSEEFEKGAPVLIPAAPPGEGDNDDKSAKPKKGQSVFNMGHVNEVSTMKDHVAAKKMAHDLVDKSSATPENKKKIKMMIDRSKSSSHLAQGMTNHILAHPGEGLKVIKNDSLNKAAKDMVGDDVDSSMLMSELESMAHHIEEIKEHLNTNEVAPDWVKAKVSKSASNLSDVAHYIMGVKENKK